MYGINARQRNISKEKIRNVKFYLDNHFVNFGDITVPYSHFFKNAYVNPQRYIAEVQNRAWSIYNYARSHNLVNVFCTITCPSEHHKLRTLPNGKMVKNPKYNKDWTPKTSSKYLSNQLARIFKDRTYSNIPKDQRCYFRVTEPHKDGTPHLHISFFIPSDMVDKFVKLFNRLFPSPQGKIETNITNPVSYLMKYVLKTLDDLRYGEDKISDLSLWYVYHGICRFYTSRTLISLDVYRVLGGKYTLNELSIMYKEKRLTVYVDPVSNKPLSIFDEYGQIWHKKIPIDINFNKMRQEAKPKLREKTVRCPLFIDGEEYLYINGKVIDIKEKPFIPSRALDLQLYEHYQSIDMETVNLHHFGLVKNECIARGLIDGEISPINHYSLDYEPYLDYEEGF